MLNANTASTKVLGSGTEDIGLYIAAHLADRRFAKHVGNKQHFS